MQVRRAETSDVAGIATAYLASWRAAYHGLLAPAVLEEQAGVRAGYDWVSAIRAGGRHVAVAVDGDQVVGVVEATEPPGGQRDLPEIAMLYVVPRCWGIGVGSALLTHGTGWIADGGWPEARLRVVAAHPRPRRFYEREGWRLDTELGPAHNGYFDLVYYRRELPA